jgi:hypothetical protein
MFSGLGSLIGGIGNFFSSQSTAAASELLAAGDITAAGDYTKASDIATQNVGIEGMSEAIQQAQLNRKIYKTASTQVAASGANNMGGGSAGDLMRETFNQGSLAKTLVTTQGDIQKNAFMEQATAYQGMAGSANAAAAAAIQQANAQSTGGLFGLLGGLGSFFAGLF